MHEPVTYSDAREPDRVAILGTSVSVSSFAAAQQFLASLVERRAPAYLSCANAYSVTIAAENPEYQSILNGAAFVMADGMPVVWALKWLGHEAERVHADDLFLACCARFPQWRHFLLGGRAGQVELVAKEMRRRFPGIQVVGWHATPVRPVPPLETDTIVKKLRAARPDVVWAGMGTPAQDEWMRVGAPAAGLPMVGVGSLFDLLSGRTKAAPHWIKRSGLQWVFRLAQEPRRLMFRYLYHNFAYVTAFSRQFTQHTLKR